MLTYSLGLYFGSQEIYQVPARVIELMHRAPDIFVSKDNEKITPITVVDGPHHTLQHLADMQNEYALCEFAAYMHEQGLQSVWYIALTNNSRNCIKVSHGLPLVRTV